MNPIPVRRRREIIALLTPQMDALTLLDASTKLAEQTGLIVADLPQLIRTLDEPAIKEIIYEQGIDSRTKVLAKYIVGAQKIVVQHDAIWPITRRQSYQKAVRAADKIRQGYAPGTRHEVVMNTRATRDNTIGDLLDKEESLLALALVGGEEKLMRAQEHRLGFCPSWSDVKYRTQPPSISARIHEGLVKPNTGHKRYLLINPEYFS